MKEIARKYLGNISSDSDLAELVSSETCLEVFLSHSDRPKGRIHGLTSTGIEVGIIKSRDRLLNSGDVFQTDSQKFLLVRFQEQKLLVLDLSALETAIAPVALVNLGHVLGNHHYPISTQGNKIYVQLTTEAEILEKIIEDLKIPGLQIAYETQDPSGEIVFASHSH